MKEWMIVRVFFAVLACVSTTALAADGVHVQTSRSGAGVAVSVQASIRAPRAVIWGALTDYDHLSGFVPGMKQSRVIGRRGQAAIVEQDGEARLLFFTYPIRVVVEATEHPPDVITVSVVRGNLRQLEGRYQIEQGGSADEYVLRWNGIVEPDTVLPLFITMPLMRSNIENQFAGMVREIERRSAAGAQREIPPGDR